MNATSVSKPKYQMGSSLIVKKTSKKIQVGDIDFKVKGTDPYELSYIYVGVDDKRYPEEDVCDLKDLRLDRLSKILEDGNS